MALRLAFLWHMHQPDYRDPSGVMQMPWVFLHAIRNYYDMPWYLTHHTGIRATFNLTPSLMIQLRLYAEKGAAADRFLTLLQKDPGSLDEASRRFVLEICRSVRPETMAADHPRAAALFAQGSYDDDGLVDLQTLFLLAWSGNYLRRHDPVVRRLWRKSDPYDRDDREELLGALLAFVPNILPFYRRLMEEGRIALSTTPLNHPILPLLLDMDEAVRANTHTAVPPNRFSLEGDAVEQVRRAVALFEEIFGRPPKGFWPAEGAVSERAVRLMRDEGAQWIATDEAILLRSLGSDDRKVLYRPWRFDDIFIAFRDHALSDLIGFTYRHMEPEAAAEDFVGRLREVAGIDPNAVVSVILDGENAWEFYPDNAVGFLGALYGKVAADPAVETVTMERLAAEGGESLPKLAPGSWIYGTFDTWVGHPQKTRADYGRHAAELDEAQRAAALEHFLAAECSDWFWWYGDDHHTEYADRFDALFRAHLLAVYRIIGMAPPGNLLTPIHGREDFHAWIYEPKSSIHPRIDGQESDFFEWVGSGMIDERRFLSTMDGLQAPVARIYWGQDRDAVYLRFDGDIDAIRQNGWLRIHIRGMHAPLQVDLSRPRIDRAVVAATGERIEVALSKRELPSVGVWRMRFELVNGGRVIQTLPGVGELSVDPREDYAQHWFV